MTFHFGGGGVVTKLTQAVFLLAPSRLAAYATEVSKSNVDFSKTDSLLTMQVGSEGHLGVIAFGALNLSNKYLRFMANPDLDSPQVLLMVTPQLHMSNGAILTDNATDHLFVPIIASPDMVLNTRVTAITGGEWDTRVLFLDGVPSSVVQQATQVSDSAPIFQSDFTDEEGVSADNNGYNQGGIEADVAAYDRNVFYSANDPAQLLGLNASDNAVPADAPPNPSVEEDSPNIEINELEPSLILEESEEEVQVEKDDEVMLLDEVEEVEEVEEEVVEEEAVEEEVVEEEKDELEEIESVKRVVEKKETIPSGIDIESKTNTVYLDELESGGGPEVSEELSSLIEESRRAEESQRKARSAEPSVVLVKER